MNQNANSRSSCPFTVLKTPSLNKSAMVERNTIRPKIVCRSAISKIDFPIQTLIVKLSRRQVAARRVPCRKHRNEYLLPTDFFCKSRIIIVSFSQFATILTEVPSGKSHDFITLLIAVPVFATAYAVTWSVRTSVIITLAFLFGGLMFGPDLDTTSKQYSRWRFFRFLWFPYRTFFKHRSRWSHGLVCGPPIRVVYFSGNRDDLRSRGSVCGGVDFRRENAGSNFYCRRVENGGRASAVVFWRRDSALAARRNVGGSRQSFANGHRRHLYQNRARIETILTGPGR